MTIDYDIEHFVELLRLTSQEARNLMHLHADELSAWALLRAEHARRECDSVAEAIVEHINEVKR